MKFSTLLLIFFLWVSLLHAQSSIALKVQPALTNLDGIDYSHFGGRAGFSFQYRLNEHWELTAGLGYVSAANRTQTIEYGAGHDITRTTASNRLHSVDLEAVPGFRVHKRIRISGGGYAALLLHAGRTLKFQFTDNGIVTGNSLQSDITAQYRQIDLGIRANIGLYLSEKVNLHLMYSQSLRQLSVLDAFFEVNHRPQLFGLGIDWKFLQFN